MDDGDLTPAGRLKKLDATTALDGPPWAGSFTALGVNDELVASLDPEWIIEYDDTESSS